MSEENNLNLEEEIEKIIIDLENLSTSIEKENHLEALYSYYEKFCEKLFFVIKKISITDIRLSILQKDISGKIILDNEKPVLENFSIQDCKLKCP